MTIFVLKVYYTLHGTSLQGRGGVWELWGVWEVWGETNT